MSDTTKITLPHGAISWISNFTGLGRDYVREYITSPSNFKGSPTAASKILDGIEAYKKDREELEKKNELRLNALLSSMKE